MNDVKEYRFVSTGLENTKKNFEILDGVLGQLSDGIWENSPRMDGYWRFADIDSSDEKELKIKIDNKPFIQETIKTPCWRRGMWVDNFKSTFTDNKFYHMDDKKVKDFFANKIKQIIKIEQSYGPDKNLIWKRDNTNETHYLNYHETITIADCYKAYDILKGRKIKQ